jgi:DNA-binding Lrp family transcriptional regulator
VNVESTGADRTAPDFAFLTSYGKTLLLIADDPRIRMRDIADRLNVTERAAQRIVADLVRAGYIDRQREGRRNRYSIRADLPLGLPLQRDVEIGALVTIVPGSSGSA